ncbi:MAG TPA: hypothetical protein VK497_04640 [Candidatus Saccharimonadales bacterium]|nr:hypothetical protein [Candidatus Saccharimonadales bacterium]
MRKKGLWQYSKLMLLTALIVSGSAGTAFAETSTSDSYQITETQFGVGSTSQSCSSQYCAKTSIGDMTSGDSKSSGGSAKFGSVTDSEPLLEVIIDPGVSNLGVLTTESTATKTMTVRIRNYLSGGYTLQIMGDPPKYGGHTLHTPTTPTASSPGTEQFAINASANTTPNVGAGPVQVPSDQMSFGVVNDDYKLPNLFKYVSGSVVAHSPTESGRTDYTISMIVNISNSTPAGHFAGDFSAVVIPVY